MYNYYPSCSRYGTKPARKKRTDKEIALAKLTVKDKRALGLI